jgi:hypothetical protein
MLLKKMVLALLIANLAYAAYALGWLSMLTGGDSRQREPERLQRQVNPAMITVTAIDMQAKPQTNQDCVPAAAKAEQWIIYMGPYTTLAQRDAKIAELARLQVASSVVTKPSLKIGFSLGNFSDETSATQALHMLSQKGIRSAKIVLWQSASSAAPASTACN